MPQQASDESKNVKLTAEEAKQLEEAFKDKAFCKLMADYVTELSDPRYKEEQEAYIAQLEAQNELPFGKALVRPSGGFVVKCMHQKKRNGNSAKSKLFLNVVHSEQVAEPTNEKSDLGGSSWSVPYAIGPIRMEHDKSGNNLVATFDCCFHPLSLRHAHGRKEFLDLIIGIAKDAAASAFKKSGDEVDVLPGYTILRGVTYKSGTPKALMVSSAYNDDNKNEARSSESSESSTATTEKAKVPAQSSPKVVGSDGANTKPMVPKYKIVERGVFDIAEHTIEAIAPEPRRPKQLVVHVYLDKATSAANINLDVSETELAIKPDSKCRYKLEVELPYPVISQKGNASFDKKLRTLIVTLPVLDSR